MGIIHPRAAAGCPGLPQGGQLGPASPRSARLRRMCVRSDSFAGQVRLLLLLLLLLWAHASRPAQCPSPPRPACVQPARHTAHYGTVQWLRQCRPGEIRNPARRLGTPPRHATPGHARPRQATPGHARPRQATPRFACSGLIRVTKLPTTLCRAIPFHAAPRQAGRQAIVSRVVQVHCPWRLLVPLICTFHMGDGGRCLAGRAGATRFST